jgi:hypothetical protein
MHYIRLDTIEVRAKQLFGLGFIDIEAGCPKVRCPTRRIYQFSALKREIASINPDIGLKQQVILPVECPRIKIVDLIPKRYELMRQRAGIIGNTTNVVRIISYYQNFHLPTDLLVKSN